MKPPTPEENGSAAEPDPPLGTVVVGRYALGVGGGDGAIVKESGSLERQELAALKQAFAEEDGEAQERTAPAAFAETVEDASVVTGEAEKAVSLSEAAARGELLDPASADVHVTTLLGLLERLDRGERWQEELRVARALATLCSLLRRWSDLLRTLRAALSAAEKLGDLKGLALEGASWAEHELGSLRIATEDVVEADEHLSRALAQRRELGDPGALAATEHNLQVQCSQMRRMLREKRLLPRPRRLRPSRLALAVGAAVVALGIAAGTAVGGLPDGGDETVAPTLDPSIPTTVGPTTTAEPTDTTGPTTSDPTVTGTDTSGGATTGTSTDSTDPTVTGSTTGSVELRVTFPKGTEGIIYFKPARPECTANCAYEFDQGERVRLSAKGLNGFAFQEWEGACQGTECTVTMDGAREVTPVFSEPEPPTEGGESVE